MEDTRLFEAAHPLWYGDTVTQESRIVPVALTSK